MHMQISNNITQYFDDWADHKPASMQQALLWQDFNPLKYLHEESISGKKF